MKNSRQTQMAHESKDLQTVEKLQNIANSPSPDSQQYPNITVRPVQVQ